LKTKTSASPPRSRTSRVTTTTWTSRRPASS